MIHNTSASRTSVKPVDLSSPSNISASTNRQPGISKNPAPSTEKQDQGGPQRSPMDALKRLLDPLMDLLKSVVSGAGVATTHLIGMATGLLSKARSLAGF